MAEQREGGDVEGASAKWAHASTLSSLSFSFINYMSVLSKELELIDSVSADINT